MTESDDLGELPTTMPPPMTTAHISVRVNGESHDLSVPADRRLVDLIRDDLGLTGTKIGCDVGVCGACTVLVDGRPTSSCITLAIQSDGADLRTVEILEETPQLRRLQEAFVSEGGTQCGYCTSGQLMAASVLISSGQAAGMTEDEIAHQMLGNLCRCTGYYGIRRAIRLVAG
jgi:carbon-monoxide dehydrogenase small subunit